MLNENAYRFSEMKGVLDLILPVSPYGTAEKGGLGLGTDGTALAAEFALVEEMARFVRGNPGEADKIEYHLSRLPLFRLPETRLIDQFLVFSVKRFLTNWKGVLASLPQGMAGKIVGGGLSDESSPVYPDELLRSLERGGDGDTFTVSDRFDPRLGGIRMRIGDREREMAAERSRIVDEISGTAGIDFSRSDTVTIPGSIRDGGTAGGAWPGSAGKAADRDAGCGEISDLIAISPYDEHSVTARIRYSRKWFDLSAERDRLIREERGIEEEIIAGLAEEISRERERIERAMRAAGRTDWLLARTRFSLRFSCVSPVFTEREMALHDGRFLPLLWECEKTGREYQKPDFTFRERANVIRGCNMGGKTVLLKTICFFQIMAQTGIPVPAGSYRTVLFDGIYAAVKDDDALSGGLSSFGREIRGFTEAYRLPGRILFLMDEFANTTGSMEGEALAGAIISEIARNDSFLFFVTHFVHLRERAEGRIGWYRIRGFDRSRYGKILETDGAEVDRIGAINRSMDYTLVVEESASGGNDALEIAGFLGLPDEIGERARRNL